MPSDANSVLLASTALTATGQGTGVSLRNPSSTTGTNLGGSPRRGLKARVICTLVTGTAPTAVFSVQHSDDNATWTTLAQQLDATLVAAGETVIPFETDKPWVRLAYTIGGTTPSFTTQAALLVARP